MDSSTLCSVSDIMCLNYSPPLEHVHQVPPQATAINIRNLRYVVNERQGSWWQGTCFRTDVQKVVLNNVSMSIESGQLTAVAGSSGSGKTSLLDVITFRSEGKVSGDMIFKRQICTKALMKTAASYVMQSDRLLPNLTVRETLLYTAYLKLPNNYTKFQVKEKVQCVINEMGLRHVAGKRIGGAMIRGISGGEKRRVTIAIQLLQDPEILLLDEPTSGLDSFTARYLVSNLADLAHRGKIVLLTIHQPRSDIFKLLDQVAILSRGDLVYAGPANNLVPYFTGIGYPCPKYSNPMDRYKRAHGRYIKGRGVCILITSGVTPVTPSPFGPLTNIVVKPGLLTAPSIRKRFGDIILENIIQSDRSFYKLDRQLPCSCGKFHNTS